MPRFPHACSSILFSQPRRNRVSYFWAFLGCAVALGAPWEGESKENPKVAKAGLPRAPTVFSPALSPAHPPPSTGPANVRLLLAQPSAGFIRLALSHQLKYPLHSQKRGAGRKPVRAVKEELVPADRAMYPIPYQYHGKRGKAFWIGSLGTDY